MLRAVALRILWLIPTLIAVSFVTFSLMMLAPSDPAEVAIRVNAMVPTPELIAQTRHELGLDEPFLLRYVHWAGNVLTGDFGKSFVTGRPVLEDMLPALGATFELALAALAIIITLSALIAMLCAMRPGGVTDRLLRAAVFITGAMPSFWVGLLLMWFFAVYLNWLPTSGMSAPGSIILPAVTLSLMYLSSYARLMRSEMLAALSTDWVLFARSRGLSRVRILMHVWLNSLRGSAAALGMSIPKLIAGAFVIETVFAWPGIGRLCVSAIFNRDLPVISAYALLTATLFVLFNLASEIFIPWLDPRDRLSKWGQV